MSTPLTTDHNVSSNFQIYASSSSSSSTTVYSCFSSASPNFGSNPMVDSTSEIETPTSPFRGLLMLDDASESGGEAVASKVDGSTNSTSFS
mmetsp:Transcript_28563/g.37400  ORF Transcript_28563/g.37400 Transcript_28563/m.37400 type:complete len:91 (+) Transcript_28563:66-338(+)